MVKVRASYIGEDKALVRSGSGSFVVEQRDKEGREKFCPVELIAASLAS